MRRHIAFLVLLSMLGLPSFGGERQYPFYFIPDSLAIGANAVLRESERVLTIHSDNKADLYEKTAVTILNEKGDEYGIFVAFYDRQRSISGISIRIYDALGNQLEKVKPDEIMDYSAVSGFSLYEDDRMLFHEPVIKTYPYTVVTEYTIHYSGIIQFPLWQPQLSHDLSVQQASFTTRLQKDNDIRWKQRNIPAGPDSTLSGNELELRWMISQLPAFKRVAFMPPMEEITPNVVIAPMEFSYAGHKGSFRSWEDFGQWTKDLLENRDIIGEGTGEEVRSLLTGISDTTEMIRKIYQYVQERTRYVSIQYGIGGFQPFEASVVDEVGYGDCKALTNYVAALLGEVGIKSHYTLVHAGPYSDDILPDFPSQQFNHVILQVPLSGDTIWLECTNQEMPFSYLGRFTADRTALAITDTGGELVRTQRYEGNKAYTSSRSEFSIDENGDGRAGVELTYFGLDYDDVFALLHEDRETQKKWLYENACIPNASIEFFSFRNLPERIPKAVVSLEFSIPKYAARSGKRLFIPLNAMNAQKSIPPSQDKRKLDIHIRYAIHELDTVTCSIPEGYEIEHLPGPTEISNKFGYYRADVDFSGDRIVYSRKLELNKGVYPADTYPDIYEFYKSVVKADDAKVVLKVKE